MKNIKGYYSWIHSLKEAAMLSQYKGQQMLNESASKKPDEDNVVDPNWKPDFQAVAGALQRPGEQPVINPKHPGDASLSSEQIFDKIKREKIARGDQRNFVRDINPNDADMDGDGDGDANEVAARAAQTSSMPSLASLGIRSGTPKASSPSLLPAIQSGAFPPPSAAHPPAELPTEAAAAAKVRELNAPGDAAKVRAFHQQQATEEARKAVEDARARGLGPEAVRKVAQDTVDAYKARRRAELRQTPPESATAVVHPDQTENMTTMESVNSKINRFLNEEEGMSMDGTASKRPGTTYDTETAGELELPRSIRKKIKGAPTHTNIFKTLISIIDNPNDHDPADVAYADNFFKTIARATKPEE